MKSHITTIRAVTVEFAMQFVRPYLWWALGIIGGLLVIVGILAFTISQWWLLLAVPIVLLGLVGTVIWQIVRFIASQLSPKLNVQQKTATKKFVTKIHHVTETVQTPYPLIMFRIVKDIITRTDTGLIQEVTQQSTTLRPDFEELRKLF
jgi:hypothetical protein